jgi:hypothetical protein
MGLPPCVPEEIIEKHFQAAGCAGEPAMRIAVSEVFWC